MREDILPCPREEPPPLPDYVLVPFLRYDPNQSCARTICDFVLTAIAVFLGSTVVASTLTLTYSSREPPPFRFSSSNWTYPPSLRGSMGDTGPPGLGFKDLVVPHFFTLEIDDLWSNYTERKCWKKKK